MVAPAVQPIHQQVLQVDARSVSVGASPSDVAAAVQHAANQTAQVAEAIHSEKMASFSADAQMAIRSVQLEKEQMMRMAQSTIDELKSRRLQ